MKRNLLLTFAVLLLFVFSSGGCGGGGGGEGVLSPTPQPTVQPTGGPTSVPTPLPTSQPGALDGEIAAAMEQGRIPGVGACIVKDGRIAWMKSYGYANYDTKAPFTNSTPLMLASVSKVFTGIALMQLHEGGRFGLDDAVNEALPFQVTVPGYSNTPITYRMLLTHTSSIADSDVMDDFYNWNGDPAISLQGCMTGYFSPSGSYYDVDNFYNKRPGTYYDYSNMGAALEGYLVECFSGQPFNEYCNAEIFDVLGMENTHWFLREYQDAGMVANPHENYRPISNYGFADYPDGMLHSSVADLARAVLAILQGGVLDGGRILSESLLDSMFVVQNSSLSSTQGLQFYQESFRINGNTKFLWGHSGGEVGISTEMYFDREKGIGIVVLANAESDATSTLVARLYEHALGL